MLLIFVLNFSENESSEVTKLFLEALEISYDASFGEALVLDLVYLFFFTIF